MSLERDEMIKALRDMTIPHLRKLGFRGTFPHFRRMGKTGVDLMSFQFDRHGGGFVIEISKCPPDGITTAWGEHIPAHKVTALDLNPDERIRIQPKQGGSTSDWFRYDTKPFLVQNNIYVSVARSVIPLLEKANTLWKDE